MGYGCADAPPRPIGRFPRTPLRWEPIRQARAVNAKARVAQPIGFRSMTAAAECPVTFRYCFYRWKARLWVRWGSSAAQGTGGRVRTPAPAEYPETCLSLRRGRSQTGPRAHNVRPYGGKRTGSVGSVWPGAAVERHQGQILQTQGPVARRELRVPLRFCAPEILLGLADMRPPVMGDRG